MDEDGAIELLFTQVALQLGSTMIGPKVIRNVRGPTEPENIETLILHWHVIKLPALARMDWAFERLQFSTRTILLRL